MEKIYYFKVISHFAKQRDDYSNVSMVVELSTDLINWKQIYKSNSYKELIDWLASTILDNYYILADFRICSDIFRKIFENKNYYETQKQENQIINHEEESENYCDKCLLKSQTSYDDQEISKDLILDEVISSQHLEIERLTTIIKDLVTTNLKLVEILGKTK